MFSFFKKRRLKLMEIKRGFLIPHYTIVFMSAFLMYLWFPMTANGLKIDWFCVLFLFIVIRFPATFGFTFTVLLGLSADFLYGSFVGKHASMYVLSLYLLKLFEDKTRYFRKIGVKWCLAGILYFLVQSIKVFL